jgi:hypothetical protein
MVDRLGLDTVGAPFWGIQDTPILPPQQSVSHSRV